ncbi:MAG: hypothetical protein HN712_27505 [Gemmatimonadetes bacterium]|nr:hypothetical protein [Gemmatimonadota bacterium]MBT6149814.1 hypothetical protein [Gemmatimonadota bacterium]MBT7864088.1 hypothetical protein [Gemmatimonadota bacterium]
MLTAEQIQSFKDNAYLVLPGFVDPEQISRWGEQFWAHIGADSQDASTWPDNYVIGDFAVDPRLSDLPQMQSIVDQLGGGLFSGGGGSMLVQWPKPEGTPWQIPAHGHIDGYGPGGWSGGFMLAATTYLEDVEAGGGSFVYWPKSHLGVHDFFQENPDQLDGSFVQRNDWDDRSWGLFCDRSPSGPVEFTAKAGDTILWHSFLCHTGSMNVGSRPRQAVFSRWNRFDREEMKYDTPANLWKYWAI